MAAIGVAQFQRLGDATRIRRSNAATLSTALKNVITPVVKEGREHVWHQYTIRLDKGTDRAAAVKQLQEAGIGTGVFYPLGAHHFPHIREIVGDVDMPVTDRVAETVLSLPVHPLLSAGDLERIAAAVNRL
jgi:dTDP-4-amino-4,6-dideoxygalactose transaminase